MYTINQAAKIAGIKVGTARIWFERGHLAIRDDDKVVAGGTRLLSEKSVLILSIVAALRHLNVSIIRAAYVASNFAEMGDFQKLHGMFISFWPDSLIITSKETPYLLIYHPDDATILSAIGNGAAILPIRDIIEKVSEANHTAFTAVPAIAERTDPA